MHKLVRVARVIVCWIVTRLCAAEDSDGVNGRPAALYSLGGIDGILSDLGLETIRTRRRAVGEEHNDLLGIRAIRRNVLGQLQAIVSVRGTGRSNGIDRFLKALCAIDRARRQPLHCLRVVIDIAAVAIGIITDLIVVLLTCELYDGNLMLFARILNLLVLRGDGIDKAVGSSFERDDTLGGISAAHGVIHRARSVQHQHDVERLAGDRRIGCRRDSRQRGQEIRIPVLGSLDRLVGPDSANVLSCYFLAVIAAGPELPAVTGVVVDYLRRSVHSGTGPGVGLGQHGKCCSRQHKHYGKYHRQETPRVPTHRVSLLAVSDLASA